MSESTNQLAESKSFSLSNVNLDLCIKAADLLSKSSLIPKEYKGNPSNCFIAVNIAERLGADPFAVMQSMDVIHGRPSWRAGFLIGMVNASRRFTPLQFEITKGEQKTVELTIQKANNGGSYKLNHSYTDMRCIAWAKDLDGNRVEGPEVSMDMAIAEGWLSKPMSKWLSMQEVMIRYRAGAFFARLYAPDITLGMQTQEELEDIEGIREARGRVVDGSIPESAPAAKITPSFSTTKPAASPQAQPQPEQAEPPSEQPDGAARGYIVDVDEKSGDKDGKPWTRYRVSISYGDSAEVATTFSNSLGAIAKGCIGRFALVTVSEDKRGLKLVHIKPSLDEAADEPADDSVV